MQYFLRLPKASFKTPKPVNIECENELIKPNERLVLQHFQSLASRFQ